MSLHDPKLVRERLVKFLRAAKESGHEIKQSHVARGIGLSPTVISAFLSDDYKGDVPGLCKRLTAYIEEQEAKARAGALVLPFVDIRQAKVGIQCFEMAQANHSMVAVISVSGYGKTIAIDQYSKLHPSTVLIKPWVTHGPSAVLQDLCEAIGENDKGLVRGLAKRIVYKLGGTDRLLIVDDAHDLGPKALQVLRNVYDATGIGIALCGNQALETKLVGTTPEMEQIARRVIYRRRLPQFVDADAKHQIGKTLPHLDAAEVLGLFHPKAKQSPAWVGKVLYLSGKLAENDLSKVTMDHIEEALKMVV